MKTTLLLLPGSLCNAALFRYQIARFGDEYDIKIADLSGSDNVEEMGRRVLAELPKSFILCGLSLGGIVALEIMTQAPRRVERLALLDTNYCPMSVENAAAREQEIQSVAPAGEQALLELIANDYYPSYVSAGRVTDQKLQSVVVEMARTAGMETMVNQWRAVMGRPDYTRLLPGITCPTLVLCGEEDALCSAESHRSMAAQIPGASLKIIPGCGHLSALEAPDAVNSALSAWLQK